MIAGPEAKRARAEEIRRTMWGDSHADRIALLRRMEPDLAETVLLECFGGSYADDRLSLQQRSLLTIASLVTQGRHRQLASHLEAAHNLGLSREELSAAVSHLFLYVGLPSVIEGLHVLDEVFRKLESTGGPDVG